MGSAMPRLLCRQAFGDLQLRGESFLGQRLRTRRAIREIPAAVLQRGDMKQPAGRSYHGTRLGSMVERRNHRAEPSRMSGQHAIKQYFGSDQMLMTGRPAIAAFGGREIDKPD